MGSSQSFLDHSLQLLKTILTNIQQPSYKQHCRSQLTCVLCTLGVKRTGLGPKGVVVCSWVYLLGGWKRLVGETMLGSENNIITLMMNMF